MLKREQAGKIRKRLVAERKKLEARIRGIDQGGLHESMPSSTGELSMYDNHPADVGSEIFERSKDYALRENASVVIKAIDEALYRVDQGRYGVCGECGMDIPAERLEALPYTTLCLDCKEKNEEKTPEEGRRPVEEAVMAGIYSRPFIDEIGNEGFDWEDSFQEVARWGEHAGRSGAGAYYGPNELNREDRGSVEDVDEIPYEVGEDGAIYKSFGADPG